MRKYLLVTVICLMQFNSARGQYFSTGEDPARLKWRQITTANFQLIYPDYFEAKAQQLANYFELAYEFGSQTLQHNPRKISIIFHTENVRSNGLVGWAPRRMEIFTPPHQDNYAQDWLEQLVLHEFRHVVQIDKIHSQLPQIMKILFGEQISALVTGVYLPFWFLEGDAVISETALSNRGRGRLPSFLMEHKAQVVEKGIFSYDKAYNGSFRDFVPDHYKLGYWLTGESRVRYGETLWKDVVDRVAKRPLSLTPVNHIIKRKTGLTAEKLYHSVFDSLRSVWLREDHSFIPESFDAVVPGSTRFVSYRHNHILPSGEYVSLKSSFNKIPSFVKIDQYGKEKVLFMPGHIFDESVGYSGNYAVWSEFVPDYRWSHSGRSLIRIYNFETKIHRSFYPEYKCFAPVISPDKQYVATVEANFENKYFLSVYSAVTGSLIIRFGTSANNYFFSPAWRNNEELVVAILTEKGKELALVNPFEGKSEMLPVYVNGEIKQLVVHSDTLYFIAAYSGKDELYRTSLNEVQTERIARARFGLAYPAIGAGSETILMSDYTANGYQLVRISSSHIRAEPLKEVEQGIYALAESLAVQEPGIVDFNTSDSKEYPSKPYRKVLNMFNIHSWAPFVFDVSNYNLKPGAGFVSQNKLGTATATAGYEWNTSEKSGQYYLTYEYRGLYPVVAADARAGSRASEYYQIDVYKNTSGEIIRRDTTKNRFTWSENKISINSYIPINLTHGTYFRLFRPEIKYDFVRYNHNSTTPEEFISGSMQTMAYRIYFHQIMRQAYNDMLPDWGFMADFVYRHAPLGNNDPGDVRSAQFRGYLPGIIDNHGISIYAGFQNRNRGASYGFSDAVRMPRGWHSINNRKLNSFSAEYRLPLLYPDRNLSKLVYFRRVKASLFGDYARAVGDIYNNDREISGTFVKDFYSVGADLTADINFMRIYAPANAGVRTIFIPESRKFAFELLLSIDFTSF
jgi:hypothetical protein